MDDWFPLLAVIISGIVLAVPVMALIALVRTRSLRERLEAMEIYHRDAIRDLSRQIAELRRTGTQAPAVHDPVSRTAAADLRASAHIAVAPDVAPMSSPPKAASREVPTEAAQPQARPTATSVPAPSPVPETAPPAPAAAAPVPLTAPSPAAEPASQEKSHPMFPSAETPVPARVEEPPRAPSRPPRPAPPPPSFGYAQTARAVDSSLKADLRPRKSLGERLRATLPLEEVLGMNLFAKIGIVLLVLGFALLGRVAVLAMGPGGKVALLYAVAGTMLGGGIWLERKERYRLIGRGGIGGGWALLFFTTYAVWHVPAMRVMDSLTLNCAALLAVAIAMVLHTLRYRSQLVTGLAFLLAFSTVALSQDTVYALSSGVILALGIVIICLRMGWFELEIFGILASFGNHFYWLYKLYPNGVAGHSFPQFWPSCIILVLYWLTFRISYVIRKIDSARHERISTVAALLNTTLLLAIMKFQSTHPELAFYALLVLGALEFIFGQLPVTRRRRPAFIVLTIVGSLLMLAAVPFKFSGNSIALLWMIAAEALLAAGIAQAEVVFRRIALLTGIATGALVIWKASFIINLRQQSEARLLHDGVLLLACSVLFYVNAHWLARRWKQFFEGVDHHCATVHSYIGGVTIFLGTWAIFTAQWTAVAWAALMLAGIWTARRLATRHLLAQSWVFCAATLLRAGMTNAHYGDPYPHHIAARFVTFPILAAIFYAAAAIAGSDEIQQAFATFSLWSGTALLAALAWLEVSPVWVAPVWMGLGLALVLVRMRIRRSEFLFQENVLAAIAILQLVAINLNAGKPIDAYIPFLVCAASLYAVSRFSFPRELDLYKAVAYAHTWAATGLLAALAWREMPQPWLAPCWVLFALALALLDRTFGIDEFPWQAQVLAGLAVARAVWVNVFLTSKWHKIDVRLLTVAAVAGALYTLCRVVRMPQTWRDKDLHHIWSWAASIVAAWMLWSELQPVAVAVGLAIFAVVLFEWGMMQRQAQLRLQAYAALTVAFGRIFVVNLTAARLPGDVMSPAVFTVLPIAAMCLYVWARLRSGETATGRLPIRGLMAWFGTAAGVALVYFQVRPEWVATTWAAMALLLIVVAWLLRENVFLQQALALVAGTMGRSLAHNIYGGSYFTAHGWNGNFVVVLLTVVLLIAALPVAFPLHARFAAEKSAGKWTTRLGLHHPEQWFFFAPVVLLAFLIAVKMNPGMVTLSWGVEGLLVILLGLGTSQRTFRLSGLLLLLLCVAKIVCLDAWRLHERDRYITFIVLGTALTLVSMLYNRYRETVRRLL
ncbi:MAG TPA: DUF2339 domain-containing protein [Acidobacteriaceae bacterium]|nr:DUF2339 domain-containing protein [Acidobacteriaceae bacterium]